MAQFLLSLLRFCAACLAAASLLATPAAAETIELEQPAAEQCQDANASGSHKTPAHEDHQHHTHGCGSCHIHVLRSQGVSIAILASPPVRRALPALQEPPLAEPSGLFRPPRA